MKIRWSTEMPQGMAGASARPCAVTQLKPDTRAVDAIAGFYGVRVSNHIPRPEGLGVRTG